MHRGAPSVCPVGEGVAWEGQPGKSGRCVEVCARLVLAVGLMRGRRDGKKRLPRHIQRFYGA